MVQTFQEKIADQTEHIILCKSRTNGEMSNQQGKASCWRIENDHISHSASLLPWILSWRYGNRNFCPDRHSKHSQFQESWKRTHAHNLNQFCASRHKHTNIATDRNLVDAKKCTGAADLMPYCTQA